MTSLLLRFVLVLISMTAAIAHEFQNSSFSTAASTCYCTTVPCAMVGDNYLTVGGGSVGTYYYISHSSGPVVSTAKVTITANDLDKGSDTTSCTQNYSRSLDDDGIQDCDAGHILANRLGGPGNQPINIFPQSLHVNRGEFREFEEKIYDCIVGGSSSAALSWSFGYASSSRTKPDNVTYSAKFTGGSCTSFTQTFTNAGR